MKEQLKQTAYPTWYRFSTINRDPHKFLLLLASARSGSTLLQHILTTHPAISGYGETKTYLASNQDLDYLAGKILYLQWRHKIPRNKNDIYLLDKIVHNEFLQLQDLATLYDPRLTILFLIREPVGTINSFMRVMQTNEEHALFYYQTRLQMLAQYAEVVPGDRRPFFIDYRQLINDTEPLLHALGNYLGLDDPLGEEYEVTSLTGSFGVGDKSENIQSGRIQRLASPAPSPNFSPEVLHEAAAAYEETVRLLQQTCITI